MDREKKPPKCLIQKEILTDSTPPTPMSLECDNIPQTNYQTTVFLQKIIKGRAIQNILYKGKESIKGLIDELKSTSILTSFSQLYSDEAEEIIRLKIMAYKQHKHLKQIMKSEQEIKQVFCEAEAVIISNILKFLEQELERLYEQRKVHAMCMLAEKERKKREAFEAGKRQRENLRRIEHEEIFKHLTKSTKDTAAMYLEDILMEETNLKAEKDARKKIEKVARHIDFKANKCMLTHCDKGSYQFEKCNEKDDSLLANIVKDFMFPQVQKQLARKRMALRQHKYLLAAHKELYKHVENMYPKVIEIDERPEIANQIINDLINKTVDSEDALTELCPHENVAQHEALAAIRKIIKRVIPDKKKWKSSAERIVSAMIRDVTQAVVDSRSNDFVKPSIMPHITSKDMFDIATIEDISAPGKQTSSKFTPGAIRRIPGKLKFVPGSFNVKRHIDFLPAFSEIILRDTNYTEPTTRDRHENKKQK